MITQEPEQYNTTKAKLSTKIAERDGGLPACPTGQPASPTRTRGFTLEDIEAIEEDIEHAYEGTTPLPTTEKPRLVTRGPLSGVQTTEKILSPPKTFHDWLTLTAKEPYWVMQELVELASPGVTFIKRKNGLNGYHSGFDILKNQKKIGNIFYGSYRNERQNQKCQLLITGGGNAQEFNFIDLYRYSLVMEKPTITRTDLTLDTFYGELTIDKTTQAHLDGKFRCKNAPKDPKITPYGCIQPDGSNFGRSVYIGSMGSSKMLRGYEKCFERFKSILNSEEKNEESAKLLTQKMFRNNEEIDWDGVNGDKPFKVNDWFRMELQLTNGNCQIPLDVLINPDLYYSGAYPYLKEILEMTDTRPIPRLKTDDEIDFIIRVENIKAIAGSTIDDMLIMGWSNDDIVNALKGGKGASQKLIKGGYFKDC